MYEKIDLPVSPGSKGSKTFLSGVTDKIQQQYREHLFKVDREALQSVAQK